MFYIKVATLNIGSIDVLIVSLNPSHPNPGRREKVKLNVYFRTSLWCMALKAFIKPFEAPQRKVKIKF